VEGTLDSGFAQDEDYAYAGGLLEWEPSRRTAVGAFGTWVRAHLDRSALPLSLPEDNFSLTEKTWQAGLYLLHAFSPGFRTEAWVARVWRAEQRLRPDTTVAPAVDHEDRSWAGKVSVRYGRWQGFQGELGLDYFARDVIRSSGGPDPARFDDTHARLRFDIGWRFGERAYLMAGTNADLDQDNDTATGWFDGAHARFALYW
jgi:hypothetical protein